MIQLDHLAKSYGLKVLFEDLTYAFPEEGGRFALVGPNGAGKSTLLKIMCQQESADKGRIHASRALRLGYLPQEPNPHPAHTVLDECLSGLTADDWELENPESRARVILGGLGFDNDRLEVDPKTLSGGWRMRLELAKLLTIEPNFLILDEPTNHLDLPSLIWVEEYLTNFRGTLLFVSHDRALLNRLTQTTLCLQNGTLTPYAGNFDKFLESWELEKFQKEKASKALQDKIKHTEEFVERFKAKASKAKQAQSRAKQLDKLRALEEDFEDSGDYSPGQGQKFSLRIRHFAPSGRHVLSVENLTVGYGALELVSHLNLSVERGQKIAVVGENGLGKSTLLKTLAEVLPQLGGSFTLGHNVHVGYFAQDQNLVFSDDVTVLENLGRVNAEMSEKECRALLGSFLFRGDDVYKHFGALSGGEKTRMGLAATLGSGANFLILDEPTNHLDMWSAEMLTQALEHYTGTVLFVSHDRSFIDRLCTHTIVLKRNKKHDFFIGNIDEHFWENERLQLAVAKKKKNTPAAEKIVPDNEGKKLKEKLAQQKKIHEKIEALYAKKQEHQGALEEAAGRGDYKKSLEYEAQIKEVSKNIQKLEDEWLKIETL